MELGLTRDLIVSVRKGIYDLLVGAIAQGLKSDENYVSAILSGIDGILNYRVNADPKMVLYIGEERYSTHDGDALILIYEGHNLMFTIYQDKADSKLKVHCAENDLKFDKELVSGYAKILEKVKKGDEKFFS